MLEKFDKNKNPFIVPENYFENLNRQIMEQIPADTTPKKKVPLWKKVVSWSAAAAAILGAVFYLGIFSSTREKLQQAHSEQANQLTQDDVFEYMEEEVIASAYNDMLYSDIYTQ